LKYLQTVLGANEVVQLVHVLELRVAIEQQRRVVGRGAPLGVQCLANGATAKYE
jgi:hypothetical protein